MIALWSLTEHPSEPKVTELHNPILADEYVLWLDVSVYDPMLVAVVHRLKGLPYYLFHKCLL